MGMTVRSRLALVAVAMAACGGEPGPPGAQPIAVPAAAADAAPAPAPPPPPTPAPGPGVVPVDSQALFTYLRAGSYRALPAEPKNHPSRGPHSRKGMPVRVFVNPELRDSLAAGAAEHPSGAAAL